MLMKCCGCGVFGKQFPTANASHTMRLLDQQWFMPVLAWEEAVGGRTSLPSLP